MGKRYVVTSLLACLAGYAAGASAAGPAAEPAAVLRQPQGKVFISQNSATVLAQDGMPLYAGNRVIAVSGGRAEVVYADDCVVALPENSLLSVKEIGSCQSGKAKPKAHPIKGFQNTQIGQAPSIDGMDDGSAVIKGPVGDVSIGKGKAYDKMNVKGSDLITTGSGSQVTVVFKDNCEVVVNEREKVKVGDLVDKCKVGAAIVGVSGPIGGGWGPWVVGIGLGGSLIGAINADHHHSGDESPISP